MKTTFPLILIFLAFALVVACGEEKITPSQNASLQIRLTDAPASYDEVNIDLQQVMIKMKADSGWLEVDTYPGIYDLLGLTGGVDTLIVNDSVPTGEIQMLRLILGDSNYVVVSGLPHMMDTPSAQQSGLKVNLNKILAQDSLNDVLLDFDAGKSVVEKGNGGYSLKPVLRVIN